MQVCNSTEPWDAVHHAAADRPEQPSATADHISGGEYDYKRAIVLTMCYLESRSLH